jgi:ABC-type Fe3+-siderophore transport system permease subunit
MKPLTPLRFILSLAPFILFFFAALLICPAIGAVKIDLGKALSEYGDIENSMDATIFFVARMPRTLLAALAGAALALSGAAFQALLRNPLAEPFTLGVSSGGALGAVLAIKLGAAFTILGLSSVSLFSFAGSIGTVLIVYALARTRGALPTAILLLAGVTLSFFFSALILLVHYFSDMTESHRMIRWMMGGLDILGYDGLLKILPLWIIGVGALLFKARDLNQMTFGTYMAESRGVDVARSQKVCYFAASLITGAVVSLAGPIGFVGLIVPHTVRFFVGPDYRVLLPVSMFAGAGFLIICDTAARTILAPGEIPVGALTAALGGPFFLGLLFRMKRGQ